MAASPCLGGVDKKHRWLTAKKAAGKYTREARALMATQDPREASAALSLLETALSLSPRMELALELKARCLLQLRRFKEVADMLRDHIPSLKAATEESPANSGGSSSSSSTTSDGWSQPLSRERAKLLPPSSSSDADDDGFKCFSARELKKRVMGGMLKKCDRQGQWRCLVLGQACCHLGLLEDAMALLQNGKRLATAAFRRESVCWSDDSFPLSRLPVEAEYKPVEPGMPPSVLAEVESVTQLLSQTKLLIRRRTAAIAALDAGLHAEAVRHFGKILDGRRGAPQGFLAECYMHRATAYRTLGRIAESIADCNRTLALESACIQALETRAALLEQIRCLPDCLHDLEHLKLLYNTILRDRKLPGPAWKRQYVQYREIPGRLCALSAKIQGLKQRVASRETGNVDYHALMGLRQGCSRSELERAHLLLSLKHKPDKAVGFLEKCEFADERDVDTVKDRARMLAMLLYRLIQKGHNSISSSVSADEEAEKGRAALQAAIKLQQQTMEAKSATPDKDNKPSQINKTWMGGGDKGMVTGSAPANPSSSSAYQGVFCRDLTAVSSLLSQVGINRPLQLKYEAAALTC
ncbi:hypothetical protein MLD38_028144 [Melastoma candidum]|uniref:Uncharacterized protein n=1 Tax=Melastoma candidum TaxID=119954 RepID=A0ACB9N2B7_9MYRT|nr:hypothetical protein MLD38_028144 [Melastoma candidum]